MRKYILILIIANIASFTSCYYQTSSDIKSFEEGLEIEVMLDIARSYYELRQYDQALSYFSKIIQIDTTIGEAYYSRAYCFVRLYQDYESALIDYLKAAELSYKLDKTYANLGYIYTLLDHRDIAMVYLYMALYLDPENKDIIDHIRLLKDLEDIDKEIESMEKYKPV